MAEMTEEQAVRALRELAEKWPKSLWLFSASGRLHVMRYLPNGERAVTPTYGMAPEASIATIKIPNDGGDW